MRSRYLTTLAVVIAVIIGISLCGCRKEDSPRSAGVVDGSKTSRKRFGITGTVFEPVSDAWFDNLFNKLEDSNSLEEFENTLDNTRPPKKPAANVVVVARGGSFKSLARFLHSAMRCIASVEMTRLNNGGSSPTLVYYFSGDIVKSVVYIHPRYSTLIWSSHAQSLPVETEISFVYDHLKVCGPGVTGNDSFDQSIPPDHWFCSAPSM